MIDVGLILFAAVARNVRNVEVRGSNPLCSTKNLRFLRFFILLISICIEN